MDNQYNTPNLSLAQSLSFVFCDYYPNCFSFIKTGLTRQNDPDSPVIAGIPIHFSLLNRLMEVHKMQETIEPNNEYEY